MLKCSECDNGTKVVFRESPLYFTVSVGQKIWYWDKDTGKFDGTSWDVNETVEDF